MRRRGRKPLVLQRLRRRRPICGVDGETLAHEVARGLGYVRPVLLRLELVVARDDCLHLLLLCVTVEGRVPAEQEIRDHTHRPDVDGLVVPGCKACQ